MYTKRYSSLPVTLKQDGQFRFSHEQYGDSSRKFSSEICCIFQFKQIGTRISTQFRLFRNMPEFTLSPHKGCLFHFSEKSFGSISIFWRLVIFESIESEFDWILQKQIISAIQKLHVEVKHWCKPCNFLSVANIKLRKRNEKMWIIQKDLTVGL